MNMMKGFGILTVAATLMIAMATSSAYAGPVIDKGDLGKYERDGKFLRPILSAPPRSTETSPANAHPSATRFVIDKGDLGRYERIGKHLRRLPGKRSHPVSTNAPTRHVYRQVYHHKHTHSFPG
jgi:hypothetical protein